jgi:hypothetical protein
LIFKSLSSLLQTYFGFIHNLRSKQFHKIDPRTSRARHSWAWPAPPERPATKKIRVSLVFFFFAYGLLFLCLWTAAGP